MRRVILAGLLAVLTALTAARLAEQRRAAAGEVCWDRERYNVLERDEPAQRATAGSALISGLDGAFQARTPTEKSGYTGLLAGRDLVLLLAEGELPEEPALERLEQESVCFRQVYAPAWYQGADGRLFALLTGLLPTTVGERTAMVWAGEQGTYLPYSLGICLGQMGYACRIWPLEPDRDSSYAALGFDAQTRPAGGDGAVLDAALDAEGPFAACVQLTAGGAEQAAARLWQRLEQEPDRAARTVVCLFSWGGQGRGDMLLWAGGLDPAQSDCPCSELDVTPTLLNLLGAAYDSRYLSGRDALADNAGAIPVSLAGSAYASWVTDAGRYDAAAGRFSPANGQLTGQQETARYVGQMRRAVYEQYVCARQVMESNYFRAGAGW